ncbi:MAG: hypothetical protein JWR37_59, partial [Mycobacterium sp.]|nr:hypothetical protein [Mycobacterium sp.]
QPEGARRLIAPSTTFVVLPAAIVTGLYVTDPRS